MDDALPDSMRSAFGYRPRLELPDESDLMLLAQYFDNTLKEPMRTELEERMAREPALLHALAELFRETTSVRAALEQPHVSDSHKAQEIIQATFREKSANLAKPGIDSAVQPVVNDRDNRMDSRRTGEKSQ